MKRTKQIIEQTNAYGAHNYHPLPVVIETGKDVWLIDVEGKKYLDMLSAYSAVNQGHCHPKIVSALIQQSSKITLTSRAFYHDKLGQLYKKLAQLTKKEMILPMNTGAEAIETALKAARRWAYGVKRVPDNQAEIIVCDDNFHGRTLGAVSLSTNNSYRRGFGPLLSGIRSIPFGDKTALESAINEKTAAFLVEPIQGEAGVKVPPQGYLRAVREICTKYNILLIVDEIQAGLGRTGTWFASDLEQVVPDVYVLGKALGGGMLPVSAVAANREILDLFEPGSHGSTFGGNPLAAAVAYASLSVLEEENLIERSRLLGEFFIARLQAIESDRIKEIRGRGLFIGIELHEAARPFCEALMARGLLCKETHERVIRLAPPLTIEQSQLEWACEQIEAVLT